MKCGHILFLVLIVVFSTLFAEGIPSNLDALLDENSKTSSSDDSQRMTRAVHYGNGRGRGFRDTRGDYYGGYRGDYLYRNGYGYRGGHNGGYRRYRNRFGDVTPSSILHLFP